MAIFGELTQYTGSNTDIQREKRLSEFQRAMMLRPIQREQVQARMIADPYDRTASTRLERINEQVNADPMTNSRTSQAYRDAIASQLYEQQPSLGFASTRPAASARPITSQAATASPSFTVGEINGRQVVAPQAGSYNAYANVLATLGLPESPSPTAFSQAMQVAKIDPNQQYATRAKYLAETMKAQANQQRYETGLRLKAEQQTRRDEQQRAKDELSYRRQFVTDQAAAERELGKMGAYNPYQQMQLRYAQLLKGKNSLTSADEFASVLDNNNIQYAMSGGAEPYPQIVGQAKFDAAKWDPTRSQTEAATINALTRTPGGSRAVTDYLNQRYAPQVQQAIQQAQARNAATPAQQPLQARPQVGRSAAQPQQSLATLESDAQNLARSVQHFQQRGMSQQQALQEIARRAQGMGPAAQQRVQAVLQRYGDRILGSQLR